MKLTKKIMMIEKSKRSNMCTNKEILIFIAVISILLYIEKINIVYCGTTSTETAVTQLQEFTRNLTDEEAEVFAREIQFQPNEGWDPQHNVEEIQRNNSIRWESVVIFVVATVVLYVIARHGDVIRDALFNLSLLSAQDIYTGMARVMHTMGRAVIFRLELATQAAELLNDPETARRVEIAMQTVRAMRELRR
jgi:hypothetical protein